MEVVASLSQGRTAAAQCGLFTYKSTPVIFEPPCILLQIAKEFVSLQEITDSSSLATYDLAAETVQIV